MLVDDAKTADTLCPCGAQIILLQNLKHSASDVADVAARHGKGEHKHRHDHMRRNVLHTSRRAERRHTARRQPAELYCKNINQKQRKEKARNAASEKGRRHDCIISLFILVNCTVNTGRNRQYQAGDQGNAHQKQCRPKMACNHLADRLRGLDRIAQVAMQKLPQPDKILDIKWFIQSKCDLLRLQRSL